MPEKKKDRTAAASRPPRARSAPYDTAFEEFWQLYPKRDGGNPKQPAWRAWNARIRDGATAGEMTDGARRYAVWIRARGDEGTRFVKQAATFLGPDCAFREPWAVNASPQGGNDGRPDPNVDWEAEKRRAEQRRAELLRAEQDER